MKKRVILCGYFSLKYRTNTAGDLIVLSVLTSWLEALGYEYDIVSDFSILVDHSISLGDVDIRKYNAMIFVCGPLADFESLIQFVKQFDGLKRIAINVSIIDKKAKILQLFDYVFPRDIADHTNYDMAIEKSLSTRVPVVGLIFVGPQKEYAQQQHSIVEKVVYDVIDHLKYARVCIDTKLPYNEYGLKDENQILSVIAKMDLIITTRLHGSILSLKANVPFIAIDPIYSGAKVSMQMTKIGWPLSIGVEELTSEHLEKMIFRALLPKTLQEVRQTANTCMEQYQASKEKIMSELEAALNE